MLLITDNLSVSYYVFFLIKLKVKILPPMLGVNSVNRVVRAERFSLPEVL